MHVEVLYLVALPTLHYPKAKQYLSYYLGTMYQTDRADARDHSYLSRIATRILSRIVQDLCPYLSTRLGDPIILVQPRDRRNVNSLGSLKRSFRTCASQRNNVS